jgi:predicted glycosyltransferase
MPDLVIVESYPFGRAALGKELIPFLASCKRSKAATACSVRDILVKRSNQAEYDQVVVNLLNLYFDAVLVHSDPRVSTLSDTFSKVESINIPIHHTGYVVRPGQQCKSSCPYCLEQIQTSHPHIVVSVGGGRSGRQLLLSTLDAAGRLEGTIPHNFLILTGPFAAPSEILDLQRRARKLSNATISSFAPCLPSLFRTCELSISMGGYNTTMELLRNSTKALVWPYGERANEDQFLRCKVLAHLGAVRMLERHEVNEGLLANCILDSIKTPQVKRTFDFEGAELSRHIALELAAKRNVPTPASPAEA